MILKTLKENNKLLQANIDMLYSLYETIDGFSPENQQEIQSMIDKLIAQSCDRITDNNDAIRELSAPYKRDLNLFLQQEQLNYDNIFKDYPLFKAFDEILAETPDLLGNDGEEEYIKGATSLNVVFELAHYGECVYCGSFTEYQQEFIYKELKNKLGDDFFKKYHQENKDFSSVCSFMREEYEDLQEQIRFGQSLERYTLSNESILNETNEEASNENKTNIKKQRK